MKTVAILTFFVVAASLSTLVSSASIRPRNQNKQNNQYPWYYWNNDGQQQYPPYYMRCGAQGISSLNVLSLCVVGLAALAFTGLPENSKTQLRSIK